jgi:hypothetical protein
MVYIGHPRFILGIKGFTAWPTCLLKLLRGLTIGPEFPYLWYAAHGVHTNLKIIPSSSFPLVRTHIELVLTNLLCSIFLVQGHICEPNFIVSSNWTYCSSFWGSCKNMVKSVHIWYCVHLRLICSGYYETNKKKGENGLLTHT